MIHYKCFMDVWNKFSNEKDERSFIQYWRILGNVIKSKGSNHFVGSGGNMHCGIPNDYKVTSNGQVHINLMN